MPTRIAHRSRLAQGEIPGRFRIVTHQQAHLQRQVLVDLPDIDSFYADHVVLTRAFSATCCFRCGLRAWKNMRILARRRC